MQELSLDQIKNCLPHRDPMLFIDRVVEYEIPQSLVAEFTLQEDNYIFTGHFPGQPVWPGVLTIEGSAQAAGILIAIYACGGVPGPGGIGDKLMYLASVDSARFNRLLAPGDTIRYEIVVDKFKGRVWKISSQILVAGEKAGSCSLTIMLNK